MPRYKLTKTSYLNDRLYPAGATVEWDRPPSLAMVPLDDAARQAKESWEAERAQRRRSKTSVGWSPAIQAHEWKRLTTPETGADSQGLVEPPLPMANVRVVGRRGRPPKPRIDVRTE